MSVGRRGLVLSVTFALLAVGLCRGPRANAQQPQMHPPFHPNGFPHHGSGRHDIWRDHLTPDQVRQLFGQFDQGDGGANKQFEDLLRNAVTNKNPNADPKQVDAAIKKLLADKEFMNRVMDLAQKHKNNPGRNPDNITPRDLERDFAKLKEQMTKDGQGDPFKVPKFDPDNLPKFDPKNFDPKNFNPEDFPHADPKNPPRIDPGSGLPLNPQTNRPFDPRTGRPLDPRTGEPEPKPDPKNINPKINPEEPPQSKIDPDTGRPQEPDPEPKFDPDRPQPPKESPEKLAKQKAYEAATALWEKNVGPIDQTPAVKQAIYDLITDREAMEALTDSKGNSLFDMFKDGGNGDGLKDLFGGMDGKWEWPKLDWKLDFGKNSNLDFPDARPKTRWPDTSGSRWPSGGGNWGGWGSFNFGGMQVPWLLFLLLLAAVVAAVVWWKWDTIAQLRSRRGSARPDGLGPWPLDPHEISTREDVVLAFEYLSVLICGPGAKVWTHSTVADELAVLARTHAGTALKLARLYELARYAPLDEPLTRAELFETRRLVCDLAGVD